MTAASGTVIVGGGIGGFTLASALRAGGYDAPIALIEREQACYDRPPLSKDALLHGPSLPAVAFPITEAQRLDVRTGCSATALDVATRTLTLDDGAQVSAAQIVLATGARAALPPIPGVHFPGVHTLRTLTDAAALHALAGSAIVIIGAGLIGAEAAAALQSLGCEVDLVDPNPVPGDHAFGATLAAHLHGMHAAHGVRTHVDTVTAITRDGRSLCVQLGSGPALTASAVLIGAGISPETSLAEATGIQVAGGIVVDAECRTSAPGVFAIGDVSVQAGGAVPAGHWDAARLDALTVAAGILGTPAPTRGAPWLWSDRYGHHIEVTGSIGGTEIVRPGEHPTVFWVDGEHLLGAASVDDPMAVRAAKRLIDGSVSVSTAALTDPNVLLRSLLPR